MNRKITFLLQRIIPLILLFFIQTTAGAQNWNQIGIDIDGDEVDDNLGYSVSLSADGLTVAVGASGNGGNGAGYVRVFKFISGVWTQQGLDINGEAAVDHSGYSVSLSDDGLTVAIGAISNDGNGAEAGHVRIYKFMSGIWTQLGADIDGEATNDRFGCSVSLSSDGLTLAIGGYQNGGNGLNAGHVRVYKFISGIWTKQGADIDGEALGDLSGWSVCLSADGSTVAIGAIANDGSGAEAGHVRVYKFISGSWTQQGADINGEATDDQSGHAISLSADGLTLAIGSQWNSGSANFAGHVRVYKFLSGTWTQLGPDFDGDAAIDRSGWSVSLSADGLTVAIGARGNDGSATEAGHVRVYKFVSGVWIQQGEDIEGEAAFDQSGWSVSLSDDGSIIAIGAIGNIAGGHVRIFGLDFTAHIDENSEPYDFTIFPNPTDKFVNIEFGNQKDFTVKVFNIYGQLVYSKAGISAKSYQFEFNEPSGIYIIEISTKNGTKQYKLVKE